MNRRLLFSLAVRLALFGVLLACAPSLAHATVNSCKELFRPYDFILHQKNRLKVVKSAVMIDGRSVYYEHLRAKPGHETLLVFSGLFTPMSDFAAFQIEFAKRSQGEGLIILSYSTQIESMLWSRLRFNVDPDFKSLTLDSFVREATAVLNAEGVSIPASILGYSYGAAPAASFAKFHRKRVSNLIMAAPLVVPGDHSAQIHTSKETYETMANLNPFFGKTLIESMRDSAARSTANSIVDGFLARQTVPEGVTKEMVVDGLFAQIRAAEAFDLRDSDAAALPRASFLLAAGEHTYRLTLQQALFDKMARESKKAGEVAVVEEGQHTLLASNPEASVEFVLRIMRHQPKRAK